MKLLEIQKHYVDQTLISDPLMIRYLINHEFHVGERFLGLLVDQNSIKLFLNDLFPYVNPEIEIIRFKDDQDPIQRLSRHINTSNLKVDFNLKSGFLLSLLKVMPHLHCDCDQLSHQLRSIKSSHEIALMREASRINDLIMSEVANHIHLGLSELEVAGFIKERQYFYRVFESFPTIVAFGDHAADPHATPSSKKLMAGEPIIIDMGCVYEGYCSDMTRTFYLDHQPEPELYQLVLKANLAGIKAVKPGLKFKDIDRVVRSVIEVAGYGDYFIHRTGHGIGQEVHEPYDVSASSETLIQAGMIFSIEPGIYLPNQSGIRIEDLICVTEDGCEVLNHYPKDQPLIK